jgi:hypothetical protein
MIINLYFSAIMGAINMWYVVCVFLSDSYVLFRLVVVVLLFRISVYMFFCSCYVPLSPSTKKILLVIQPVAMLTSLFILLLFALKAALLEFRVVIINHVFSRTSTTLVASS